MLKMNQPSVFVPPELLQTLLQQTDGTPLQREKMAAHVRELLFATPIRAAEAEAAPFVAAAVTEASTTVDQDSTRPRLVPVQPPKFIGFGDLQSPDEFLDHPTEKNYMNLFLICLLDTFFISELIISYQFHMPHISYPRLGGARYRPIRVVQKYFYLLTLPCGYIIHTTSIN